MGIFSSSSRASSVTAKLILEDGTLREYYNPIKVSHVLNPCSPYFICDADKLDYEEVLPAVSDDDELQMGQLYFVFPLSQMRHRIQGEEMAALAVKATLALTKSKSAFGSGRRKSGLGKKSVQLSPIAE